MVAPEGVGGVPPEALISEDSVLEDLELKTTSSSGLASSSAWMSAKENSVPWLSGLDLSPGGSGSV